MSAADDDDEAERKARKDYLERFARQPHPPWPDAQVKAAGSGWDAAMSWVRAQQESAGKPLIDALDDLTGEAADAVLRVLGGHDAQP